MAPLLAVAGTLTFAHADTLADRLKAREAKGSVRVTPEIKKALGNVERAFRSLKQVHLEMRPCYHKIDRRIKAHVFLCTLAYDMQWHTTERLQPLFATDGDGKDRRWTVQNVVERLKQVTRNEVESNRAHFHQTTECDVAQRQILDLLQVAL